MLDMDHSRPTSSRHRRARWGSHLVPPRRPSGCRQRRGRSLRRHARRLSPSSDSNHRRGSARNLCNSRVLATLARWGGACPFCQGNSIWANAAATCHPGLDCFKSPQFRVATLLSICDGRVEMLCGPFPTPDFRKAARCFIALLTRTSTAYPAPLHSEAKRCRVIGPMVGTSIAKLNYCTPSGAFFAARRPIPFGLSRRDARYGSPVSWRTRLVAPVS